ncbi:HNH endonuclease [Mesorhizobium sp. LSHC412B00]|nr:HNH endonuclease [Mesorhizobium sp. LSHC412B00]
MTRPPHLCQCGKIVPAEPRCACQVVRDRTRKARFDRTRPSARERGYDSKWEKESKAFLAMPQNRHCACACGRLANMVDHIVPHRGDKRLFWDRSNWQPMAASPCHSSLKQRQERQP